MAIAVADILRARGENPVAISADALQVYAGLETLTGAADAEEQSGLEHRLIGFLPVTQSFSVGEYMPLAHAEIDGALAAGRTPIVVGGTGLYLRAALTGLDLRPPPDPDLRARLQARMEAEGPDVLREEVLRRAPAAEIGAGDRNRIIRYLELLEMGHDPSPAHGESQLWTAETRVPTVLVGLVMDRKFLNQRIDSRMEAIAARARDEVAAADAAGASQTARKALGFEDLLRGDVDGLKRKTRRFAGRQMTWMRKLPGVHLVDVTGREAANVAAEVARLLAR
ncbi:MAG: tRNA dimethylallyltransferase [Thermoleophilaceae bacterium]|nr:tRNA dimethylallyltransferase [Thermoleophilaceae bacterium]